MFQVFKISQALLPLLRLIHATTLLSHCAASLTQTLIRIGALVSDKKEAHYRNY